MAHLNDIPVETQVNDNDLMHVWNSVSETDEAVKVEDLKEVFGGGSADFPAGGATGTALIKNSATDNDVKWGYSGIELTQAEYDQLTEEQKRTGEYFITDGSGGSGGGHTIKDASGTSMPSEDSLQFATMKVEDDSVNGKTVVRHIVRLTQAEYDALPSSKLTDNIIYDISDGTGRQIQASDVGYNGSNVASALGLKADKPTELTATLSAGATSLVFTNDAITATAKIDVYTDTFGVNPTNQTVSGTTLTLTFKAQAAAVSVKVLVRG